MNALHIVVYAVTVLLVQLVFLWWITGSGSGKSQDEMMGNMMGAMILGIIFAIADTVFMAIFIVKHW